MAFSQEGRVLVYRLAASERLDQDAYGMLRNNASTHILSPSRSQMDDRSELRYETDGLRIAREYLSGHVFNRQQLIDVLMGAVDAFVEAHEYMLSERSFAGSLDRVYIDDRLCLRLVYVPVVDFADCKGAREFISEVRRHLEPDRSSDDADYLGAIDNALGQSGEFSVEGFRKLLVSLTLRKYEGANPLRGMDAPFANRLVRQDLEPGFQDGGIQGVDTWGESGGFASGGGVPAPDTGAAQSANPVGAPAASVVPLSFSGMAIPGRDGQALSRSAVVPFSTDGAEQGKKAKRGLFKKDAGSDTGKRKKDKKPSKGLRKESRKKAKADKFSKPAKEKRGLFPHGKNRGSDASAEREMAESAPFAVPGQNAGGFPDGSGELRAGWGGAMQPTGSRDAGVSGGYGDNDGFDALEGSGMTSGGSGIPLASGIAADRRVSGLGGEYTDDDFGFTEVYGIPNVMKKGEGVSSPSDFPVVKKKPNDSAAAFAQARPPQVNVPAYLRFANGGEWQLVDKAAYRIGRRKSAVDFHVPDHPKVSRVHAIIEFEDGQFIIRDNDSVNHTEVNGVRVQPGERMRLTSGDRVALGDVELEFLAGVGLDVRSGD